MSSERTIEQIDRDLNVERAILVYEARNGRKSTGLDATWRHIDHLLDERLAVLVREAPGLPPRHLDGPLVQG